MARAHSQSSHQAIEALDATVSPIQFVAKRERALCATGSRNSGEFRKDLPTARLKP